MQRTAVLSGRTSLQLSRRLHQLPRELRALTSLHDRRSSCPANLSGQAFIACPQEHGISQVSLLIQLHHDKELYAKGLQGKLTEPILNKLFLHGARGSISHDLKERSALAPTEAIGEQRALVLRIGALGRCKARHPRIGYLLDGDFLGGEERRCLVPNGLVERKRVGEEAIRPATRGVSDTIGQQRQKYAGNRTSG